MRFIFKFEKSWQSFFFQGKNGAFVDFFYLNPIHNLFDYQTVQTFMSFGGSSFFSHERRKQRDNKVTINSEKLYNSNTFTLITGH